MTPENWIEHRREDGERVGWIVLEGDTCTPIDLLGRPLPATDDWEDAEAALEARGIGFLAERFAWHRDGVAPVAVRITQVDTNRISLKLDDFGAIDAPATFFEAPFPAPDALQPWAGDAQSAFDSRFGVDAQGAAGH